MNLDEFKEVIGDIINMCCVVEGCGDNAEIVVDDEEQYNSRLNYLFERLTGD